MSSPNVSVSNTSSNVPAQVDSSLDAAATYVQVAQVADVQAAGVLLIHAVGQAIALFHHNDQIYAIDNR